MKNVLTRESWLVAALPTLRKLLAEAGAPAFPDPLISVGLPSKGAFAAKRRRIGECWTEKSTEKEKRCAIFLSPTLSRPVQMLDVLLHELIHAAVGVKEGHGKPFKKVADRLGLTGPMRGTTAGPELEAKLMTLANKLGDFPHEALKGFKSPVKVQTTRMRLYVCEHCGRKIRCASDTLTAMHQCEDGEEAPFLLSDGSAPAPAKQKTKSGF